MANIKTNKSEEISQDELEKLTLDLQQFEDRFYLALSETDRFEIVSTIDDSGRPLSKEQLSLINQECLRLGVKVIYRIDTDKAVLLVNPKNLKIGYLTEGAIH